MGVAAGCLDTPICACSRGERKEGIRGGKKRGGEKTGCEKGGGKGRYREIRNKGERQLDVDHDCTHNFFLVVIHHEMECFLVVLLCIVHECVTFL